MRISAPLRAAIVVSSAGMALFPCFGQSGSTADTSLPRFGVGVKVSTLGAGIEAATAVTRQSNVRVGFNDFSYSYDFTTNGINYGSQLRLRSVEAHYDWFLRGFHVSPGLLIYNGNQLSGSASVAGGQSFTLGGDSYVSNPANPLTGTAQIDFSKYKANPMLTFGYGNLLPRGNKHFSVSVEAGVVFGISPQATLNFAGSACSSLVGICQNVASFPQFQADVLSEQNKIDNGQPPWDSVRTVFRFYPVISIGFGYKIR